MLLRDFGYRTQIRKSFSFLAISRLAAILFVALIFAIALTRPTAAAVITRYSTTSAGASIAQTGNTLALSPFNAANDDVGAFISTNTALQAGPQYPFGTTTNWQADSSSATLTLPAGSTVLYAEVLWSYTSVSSNGVLPNPAPAVAQPVNFTTPAGTSIISPDPATLSDTPDPAAPRRIYSVRSSVVTGLVGPALNGTYTLGAVPGIIDPGDAGTAVGWSLIVVYKNPSIGTLRNVVAFVGNQVVGANLPAPIVNITGFRVPPTGTVNARVSISALEGDPNKTGDEFRFSGGNAPITTIGAANNLSGPNNLITNFFASQINYGTPPDNGLPSGTLNPTGTFGNLNSTPPVLGRGVRQGWDVTNVNASTQLINGNTFAGFQGTSFGDGYVITVVGVQIDVFQPVLNVVKSIPANSPPFEPGQVDALYTLSVSNTGAAPTAGPVTLLDQLPAGLTADTSKPPFTGPSSGFTCTAAAPTPAGQAVTCTSAAAIANGAPALAITLPVNVSATASGDLVNAASIGGGDDPYNGGAPFTPVDNCTDVQHCSKLSTPILSVNQALLKSVQLTTDADGNGVPSPGDTVTWTTSLANTGAGPLSAAQITDTLPANTTIVPGSATLVSESGVTPPVAINPTFNGTTITNLLAAPAGSLASGGVITVSFKTTINAGFTGVLDNQATATTAQRTTPSSAVDNATTGIPPGVVVPPGSLPQGPGFGPNNGPPIVGPTKVNVVAPSAAVIKSVAVTTDVDSNGVPSPGDTLTYSLSYANAGPAPIPAAQIADPLAPNTTLVPGSVTIVSATGTNVTPTPNAGFNGATNQNLIGNAVTVGVGGVITVSFQVTINAGFVGTTTNRATGTGSGLPPAGVPSSTADSTTSGLPSGVIIPPNSVPQGPGGTANTGPPIAGPTTVIVRAPTVAVLKSVQQTTDTTGSGAPSPGDTLTWQVTLANVGPIPVPAAQITDLRPANTTVVAGSAAIVAQNLSTPAATANAAYNGVTVATLLAPGATLAPNGFITVSYRVTINAGFTGILANTALGTGGGITTPISSSAVDGATTNLPVGVVVPPASIPQGPDFTPNTGPPIPGPTRALVTSPNAAVIKSVRLLTDADGNGVPSPGDTLRWTISYVNRGTVRIPASQITDPLPANTTIVPGSAALVSATGAVPVPVANTAYNGASVPTLLTAPVTLGVPGEITVRFDVKIDAGFEGQLNNRATVTGGGLPPGGSPSSTADNTTTDIPTGVVIPPGSIPQGPGGTPNTGPPVPGTTNVNVLAPNAFGIKSVQLTGDADGNGVVSPGDTLTWTIAYKNTGTAPVTAGQITDALPTNSTFVAGSARVVIFSAGITPVPAINAGFNGTTVQTLLAAPVSLPANATIVISFGATINAGDTAPAANRSVLNGNGLPAGGIPSDAVDNATTGIPPGLTVPAGSLGQGPNGSPNAGPPLNQATVATPRLPASVVIKSVMLTGDNDGNGAVSPGDTLTWTVSLANTGATPLPNAQIDDTLGANLTFVPGSVTIVSATDVNVPPVVNAAYNGTSVKNFISNAVTLSPPGVITVSFRTTINAGATGTLENSGIGLGSGLPASGVPSGAADNSTVVPPGVVIPAGSVPQGAGGAPNTGPPIPGATKVTEVPATAVGVKSVQLTTDADGNSVLSAGDTLTWTTTYVNNSTVTIPNAQITDPLDPNTTLVAGSPAIVAQNGVTPAAAANAAYTGVANKNLLLAPVAIAPGGRITIAFRATLNAGVTVPVTNRATLTGIGLPAAGIPTDAVDNATTGLPAGVTVPANSLPQGANGKPNAGPALNAATFATPATVAAAGVKSVAVTGGTTPTQPPHGAAPGNVLTWTIAYGNTGSAAIPNAQITDTLPLHTSFVPGSVAIVSARGVTPGPNANTAYNGATSTNFLANPVTLGPGALIVVTFNVTVDAGYTGPIVNRAILNGGGLPSAGIPTNAADNSTTGLPPGFTVPPGSIPQGPNGQPNTGAPVNGATGVTSTAPALSPLLVQKSVDREVASAGDRLIYTIVASNPNTTALGATTIVDIMPGGVAYANGSTRIDGVPAPDPVKAGSTLSWTVPVTAAKGQHTVVFAAVIAPGIPVDTILTNTANANAKIPGTTTTLASGNAQAQTRVIGGIFNDCVTILGRVFVNHDNSGRFGRDDIGIPDVRIYMETGEYVVTDRYGKYNFACVRPGMHVLRLDTLSLPPGTAPYNVRNYDDPRSVQRLAHGVLDAGLIQNINFAIRGAP